MEQNATSLINKTIKLDFFYKKDTIRAITLALETLLPKKIISLNNDL